MNERLPVAAAVTVTVLAWSSSFPAQSLALRSYPPGELALLRFLVASVVLAGSIPVLRLRKPSRRDLPGVVAAGLLGIFCYHLLLYTGQRTVTAGSASLPQQHVAPLHGRARGCLPQ